MRQLKVKICGVRRVSDALLCAELGASHIGMIFADSSARRISEETAGEIMSSLRGVVTTVGVYQNQSVEFVQAARTRLRLDMVQLHGDEPPTEASMLAPVIKAITRLESVQSLSVEDVHPYIDYETTASMLIFDRPKGAPINTQQWLDNLESQFSLREPICAFMVAGGIDSDSAAWVVNKFKRFERFCGIDIASAVECRDTGFKDPEKLRALFRALKEEHGYAISR